MSRTAVATTWRSQLGGGPPRERASSAEHRSPGFPVQGARATTISPLVAAVTEVLTTG